jgi:hypothetical protein
VDDAKRMVDYWTTEGMTSFKAYMNITSEELGAAIQEAHAHKLKLTGHLCSITWPQAIALGIDDLEHGPVFSDTEFVADKKADVCVQGGAAAWAKQDVNGAAVQALIQNLVSHHVAVTSTLPVFEASVPGRPKLQRRVLDAMSAESAQSYLIARGLVTLDSPMTSLMRKEMDFEVAFAKAGGLLLAGPDPTGNGGVLPGFGDQREIELLVEAGFTPVQAIQIGTENGAGSHRHARAGQTGGPRFDQRRSVHEHCRHRERGNGVQGGRRLRFQEADRQRPRPGRHPLAAFGQGFIPGYHAHS